MSITSLVDDEIKRTERPILLQRSKDLLHQRATDLSPRHKIEKTIASNFAIDLAYDMESDAEEPELIVSIFSDTADRLQRLHKFDEGWWLRQSAREGGRVLIDLAYR